jgi:RNA polymerase sigma-70 factor (ECF subfamily)
MTEVDRRPLETENVVRLVPAERRGSPTRPVLEEAFGQAEKRLIRYLTFRLGSADEARDVAQATFLKLWRQIAAIHETNLTALIFVTGGNIATDIIRARRTRSCTIDEACSPDAINQVQDGGPGADRILAARQKLELIRRLLEELPAKCRHAFVAHKFQGLDYSEIAAEMGVTENMVRKHVLRAVAHCAMRFEQLEGWN